MKDDKILQAFFDVNTAADKTCFAFPKGAEILEVGVTVCGTDDGGATIKFDSQIGAAAERGDGDVGVVVIPASNQEGNTIVDTLANPVRLENGALVWVQVTAEGVAALNVVAVVKYREIAGNIANLSTVVESSNP